MFDRLVDAFARAVNPTDPSPRAVTTSAPAQPPARVHVRQGDVLLVAIDAVPDGARRRRRQPGGRLILATGEATGHAHAIAEPDAEEFRVGSERFVLVRSRAQLIHEEHAPIDVPAGAYRIVIQREFDPPPATAPRTPSQVWHRPVVD